jgi:hypothetical protein
MSSVGFELTIPELELAKTVNALGGPYTYDSDSRVRLGSGSNVPKSSVCGSPRSYVYGEINPSPAPRRARVVRVWAALDRAATATGSNYYCTEKYW